MTTKFQTGPLYMGMTEAYQLNSIYRPIKWDARDVLTDKRKEAMRKRYLSFAMWVAIGAVFVFILMLISALDPKISVTSITLPDKTILTGNEALARKHYPQAQEAYREAIQSGLGSSKVWENYDRALLLKTFNQVREDPDLLAPASSNRRGIVPNLQFQETAPGSDYLESEEWENMRQQAYEWHGC